MKPRLLVEETCHCTKSRTLNVCGNSGHDFQTKGKFPKFNGKLNNKEMGDLSLRGKTHNSLSISNSDALIVLLMLNGPEPILPLKKNLYQHIIFPYSLS